MIYENKDTIIVNGIKYFLTVERRAGSIVKVSVSDQAEWEATAFIDHNTESINCIIDNEEQTTNYYDFNNNPDALAIWMISV